MLSGPARGGVGRSTLTANLGIVLSEMGKQTAIIDGCLTSPDLALLFKLEKVFYTINDVLNGKASIEDVIYNGPKGLKIIPASLNLNKIEKTKLERLPDIVEEWAQDFDFLLIDTPSGLKQETIYALRSGEELLVVATPDLLAVSDAMKIKVASEILRLKPIGLVLNQVGGEEYELNPNEIEKIMDLSILAKIPYDREVRIALNKGQPLIERNPSSPAADAIKNLGKS